MSSCNSDAAKIYARMSWGFFGFRPGLADVPDVSGCRLELKTLQRLCVLLPEKPSENKKQLINTKTFRCRYKCM